MKNDFISKSISLIFYFIAQNTDNKNNKKKNIQESISKIQKNKSEFVLDKFKYIISKIINPHYIMLDIGRNKNSVILIDNISLNECTSYLQFSAKVISHKFYLHNLDLSIQ